MAEPTKSMSVVMAAQPPPPPPPKGVWGAVRAWLRLAFVENAALKFVALVLALTVFILVQNEESEVYHPWVSITYSQGDDRVLTSKRVDQVQLSIRGTHRRVQRLQKSRLESVKVDLQQLSSGELRFEPSMFSLPSGVELVSIQPPSMYLEFDERDEKTVPVSVDIHGTAMRGFKLGSLLTIPTEVRVSGARRTLAGLKSISTERIDLTGRRQSFKADMQLVADDVDIVGSPSAEVSVQIIEELDALALEARKVVVHSLEPLAAPAARFTVEPGKVVVTMIGSVNALEAVDKGKVEAYVEVSSREATAVGPLQLEVKARPRLSNVAFTFNPTHVTLLLTK